MIVEPPASLRMALEYVTVTLLLPLPVTAKRTLLDCGSTAAGEVPATTVPKFKGPPETVRLRPCMIVAMIATLVFALFWANELEFMPRTMKEAIARDLSHDKRCERIRLCRLSANISVSVGFTGSISDLVFMSAIYLFNGCAGQEPFKMVPYRHFLGEEGEKRLRNRND